MKRAGALLLLGVLAVAGSPRPADAGGGVRIRTIQYDSPGTDYGSDASLNDEWVKIVNTGSSDRSLRGWTLRDEARHVYTFGTLTLGAGRVVYVHTGPGTDTRRHRYWGSGWYVWNNTSDTATLKNRAGDVVDRCAYATTDDSPVGC